MPDRPPLQVSVLNLDVFESANAFFKVGYVTRELAAGL
jgi:hypothetical protein